MSGPVKNLPRKWYPVSTLPRAEKKAYQALLNKGIEVYLPLHKQLKQWSDRKKWIEAPLIPSYLFVRITEAERAEVLMTRGIVRFIYFANQIASMPDRQIAELKLLLAGVYELEVTEENLQAGEKIIIKAGPLKGLRGEIVAYHSKKQLILRLGNLDRSIIIKVPASMLMRY